MFLSPDTKNRSEKCIFATTTTTTLTVRTETCTPELTHLTSPVVRLELPGLKCKELSSQEKIMIYLIFCVFVCVLAVS